MDCHSEGGGTASQRGSWRIVKGDHDLLDVKDAIGTVGKDDDRSRPNFLGQVALQASHALPSESSPCRGLGDIYDAVCHEGEGDSGCDGRLIGVAPRCAF